MNTADNPSSSELNHRLLFKRVLNEVQTSLDVERLDSIRSLVHHNEAEVGFDILIRNLSDHNVEVSADVKSDLRALAKIFGALDHPAGSGKYW